MVLKHRHWGQNTCGVSVLQHRCLHSSVAVWWGNFISNTEFMWRILGGWNSTVKQGQNRNRDMCCVSLQIDCCDSHCLPKQTIVAKSARLITPSHGWGIRNSNRRTIPIYLSWTHGMAVHTISKRDGWRNSHDYSKRNASGLLTLRWTSSDS